MTKPTFVHPVDCTFGAPMGRHTGPHYLDTDAGRVYLHRVPLDSDGYDAGGAYWGLGQRLYEVIDQEGNGYFLRAENRKGAKAKVLNDFPEARFYR